MKRYYFKEKFFKITDKYWIIDENGDKAFYLNQKFKFLGYSADVHGSDNKKLFHIEKKLISFLPKFFIYFVDGSQMEIVSNLTFFRKSIDVKTDFGTINLKGDFWDYDFDIYLGSERIGEVNRKFFSLTDQYELTVYNEDYTLAQIALVICLNEIHDDEEDTVAVTSN